MALFSVIKWLSFRLTKTQQLTRTVLELDLASYTDVARVLEENLDVWAVKVFEDQIQSFVDRGLEAVSLQRSDVVFGTAGDNAVLIFARPELMHEFARTVHKMTVTHNQSKTVDAAKRWFRMGAATGTVLILGSKRRIVGSTLARAVRLEAAAAKGELIVDLETYNGLPENLKKCYSMEDLVKGKRDETFRVRRCMMIPIPHQQVEVLLLGVNHENFPFVTPIKAWAHHKAGDFVYSFSAAAVTRSKNWSSIEELSEALKTKQMPQNLVVLHWDTLRRLPEDLPIVVIQKPRACLVIDQQYEYGAELIKGVLLRDPWAEAIKQWQQEHMNDP